MAWDIEYPEQYNAKIRHCKTNVCEPELCGKCGAVVGKATKKNGTTYLAFATQSERTSTWIAYKTRPHFAECTGQKPEHWVAPVVIKGAFVRVTKGRKVPIGTEGIVIWSGPSMYGQRIGIKDRTGLVHWTAASNAEPVEEV